MNDLITKAGVIAGNIHLDAKIDTLSGLLSDIDGFGFSELSQAVELIKADLARLEELRGECDD